jgi:hypothetical protein
VILDVEPTKAFRPDEQKAAQIMIDRVEKRFSLKPKRLIGDTSYGTAEMLKWMVEEKDIAPHVPIWEKGERSDGTLSRSEFQWEPAANQFRCPKGKVLRTTGTVTKKDTIIFRTSVSDCVGCELKSRCSPNTPYRKLIRLVHEDARDVVRALSTTPAYQRSRWDRKKVEMLFAHLKRILKLDRLRLRGYSGAHDEFLLAATAQNLRKMAKQLFPAAPDRMMLAR